MRSLLLFILCLHKLLLPAQDNYVQIQNADRSMFQNGGEIITFAGNVFLIHKGTRFYCDSGYQNKSVSITEAYGHVVILTSDSTEIMADSLFYNGQSRKARLKKNVRLTDGKMILETQELYYDFNLDIANYYVPARIRSEGTLLSSRKGTYFHRSRDMFFRDSVFITDPKYRLSSDTLQYNTLSKRATFYGNTQIFNDSSVIFCENGWYDTRRALSSFGKNTVIVNPPQTLFSDSLYYEKDLGRGNVFGPFTFIDSQMDMSISGYRAIYLDRDQYVVATDRALLTYFSEGNDSLFLTADTLKSINYVQDELRYFYAYHKVRMYRKDMQGVCDSLFFSFRDSTFRMYLQPVLWQEESQMMADTIYLFTRSQKMDRMEMRQAASIISASGPKYFDQVKGRNITGYFRQGRLDKMLVDGNAESIYFGKNDNNKYEGANKSICARMWLYFDKNKVSRVTFLSQPEGVFTPVHLLKAEDEKFKDFRWLPEKRPLSRENLLEPNY